MLAVALATLATAVPATTYHECPKVNFYLWVRVHSTSCRVGPGVARARNPARGEQEVRGYPCNEGKVGNYHGLVGTRVTCTKGSARVQLDSTGE